MSTYFHRSSFIHLLYSKILTHFLCLNMAGYYTHINTLADVQENVNEYLHVLSRPMVIDHDHDIIWTEAYMDTVVSRLTCYKCSPNT